MVVYLLGAGASADCIPVVNQFNKTFFSIVKLRLIDNDQTRRPNNGESDLRNGFVTYSTFLKPHPTVDILAKKYFLQNKKTELLNLKKWVTVFINFLEYSRPPDERYTKFLASLLKLNQDGELTLPDYVKIISWNYDSQWELAYADFIPEHERNLQHIQRILHIYPNLDYTIPKDEKVFSITRLNGSAALTMVQDKALTSLFGPNLINYEKQKNQLKSKVWYINKNVLQILDDYEKLFRKEINTQKVGEKTRCNLSYAWEDSEEAKNARGIVFQYAPNVKKLIVIGYSFPYVNRDYDLSILSSMENLDELVIQDSGMTDERFNLVKSQLQKARPRCTFRHIKDTSEFLMPEY